MSCDCSRLAYGALLMAPIELKTILGPLTRDVVLTDVVFDLYSYPNGSASKACGHVWNVLPNQWSRLLLGGRVDVRGRRYSLESGVLCPQGSSVRIASCFFVNEPTALLSARVTGCYCENAVSPPIDPGPFADVAWNDGPAAETLDELDPTGSGRTDERTAPFVTREVLATASDAVEPRDLVVRGADRSFALPPADAVAFRVSRAAWRWASGRARERGAKAPRGTNMVVARRSPDGRLVHWAMYRETSARSSRASR